MLPYVFQQLEIHTILRVTDLIPDATSCGVLLLWSALSVVECETSHYCHTSCEMNHLHSIQYFHKMQNAVLILSQEAKERIAE